MYDSNDRRLSYRHSQQQKEQISAPLMSRFAVIDIPDYTPDEKKIIFSKFALPKILKRMSLKENECKMTDEALDAVIELFSNTSGIRDLEQAAEHIAANALYQIEVNRVSEVVFTAEMVRASYATKHTWKIYACANDLCRRFVNVQTNAIK